MSIGLLHYLIVAGVVFSLGVIGLVAGTKPFRLLVGAQLLLSAAALYFVAFSHQGNRGVEGDVFVIFIMALIVCQVIIAFALASRVMSRE